MIGTYQIQRRKTMFRTFPVARYYDSPYVELTLNMGMRDVIVPRGAYCELQIDGNRWYVNGTMEELVEFLATDHISFSEWKTERITGGRP